MWREIVATLALARRYRHVIPLPDCLSASMRIRAVSAAYVGARCQHRARSSSAWHRKSYVVLAKSIVAACRHKQSLSMAAHDLALHRRDRRLAVAAGAHFVYISY